jgi:hypothetical protein
MKATALDTTGDIHCNSEALTLITKLTIRSKAKDICVADNIRTLTSKLENKSCK